MVGGGNPLMISIAPMRVSVQQVLKNNKPVIAPLDVPTRPTRSGSRSPDNGLPGEALNDIPWQSANGRRLGNAKRHGCHIAGFSPSEAPRCETRAALIGRETNMNRLAATRVDGTDLALRVYLLGTVDFETALCFQRRLHFEVCEDRDQAALVIILAFVDKASGIIHSDRPVSASCQRRERASLL